MNSEELALIDRIITYLGVPQKIYRPPVPREAKLEQYPVEFDYLSRCLHKLGDNFFGFKIADPGLPSMANAILYGILGQEKHCKSADKFLKHLEQKTPQEMCNLLKINLLIVGPEEQSQVIGTHVPTENGETPYLILYRSYDNLFYPIVTLERQTNYLFYRTNNSILQKLTPLKVK